MPRNVRVGWVVACAAVILSTLAAGKSLAAPITSITGDYDGIRPKTGLGATTLTFTDPGHQSGPATPLQAGFGSAMFNPSSLVGLTATEINVTLNPVSLSSTLTVSDALGHSATFSLSNASLSFSGGQDTIRATATYVSDNFDGLADLSAFRSPGTGMFVATIMGVTFTPVDSIHAILPQQNEFVADWDNDPTHTQTFSPVHGHFVITPNGPGGGAGVPEPASLALWGLAGAAAVAWRRRRRRQPLAA